MKSISTSKLLFLAFASSMLFSCSVSDDDKITNDKAVEPEFEYMSKDGDSGRVEGEPMIPKPRG